MIRRCVKLGAVSFKAFQKSQTFKIQNSQIAFYSKKKGGKDKKNDDDDDEGEKVDVNIDFKKEFGPAMDKYVQSFQTNLSQMKVGKISPAQLENIKVTLTSNEIHPIKSLANIVVKSPKLLALSVYDKTNLNPISNAIRDAGLDLNPSIEGLNINVPVPPVTTESREASVKQAKKFADQTKENIRTVRGNAHKKLTGFKKSIPKDEFYEQEKKLQTLTDDFIKQVDTILEKKEKELMKN